MTAITLKNRPLLHSRLWLKAAAQVFRQRTMLWLFYFTTSNKTEHNF